MSKINAATFGHILSKETKNGIKLIKTTWTNVTSLLIQNPIQI